MRTTMIKIRYTIEEYVALLVLFASIALAIVFLIIHYAAVEFPGISGITDMENFSFFTGITKASIALFNLELIKSVKLNIFPILIISVMIVYLLAYLVMCWRMKSHLCMVRCDLIVVSAMVMVVQYVYKCFNNNFTAVVLTMLWGAPIALFFVSDLLLLPLHGVRSCIRMAFIVYCNLLAAFSYKAAAYHNISKLADSIYLLQLITILWTFRWLVFSVVTFLCMRYESEKEIDSEE